MSKCGMEVEHPDEWAARMCDMKSISMACVPRLQRIRDEHPRELVRLSAFNRLLDLQGEKASR